MACSHEYSHLLYEIKLFDEKYMCYIVTTVKHAICFVNTHAGQDIQSTWMENLKFDIALHCIYAIVTDPKNADKNDSESENKFEY